MRAFGPRRLTYRRKWETLLDDCVRSEGTPLGAGDASEGSEEAMPPFFQFFQVLCARDLLTREVLCLGTDVDCQGPCGEEFAPLESGP